MVLAAARVDAVPDVLGLSRRVAAAIRLNLAWALAYNVVALPAAALGFASPTLAAAAMLASSAFVLGNSLRLTGFSPVRYARGAVAFASFVAVLVALARFGL
jgi:Cu2+-exporting ATPase